MQGPRETPLLRRVPRPSDRTVRPNRLSLGSQRSAVCLHHGCRYTVRRVAAPLREAAEPL
jgi:hypothetical protein